MGVFVIPSNVPDLYNYWINNPLSADEINCNQRKEFEMNGKLSDVMIEEFTYPDPRTGLEKFSHLKVWADPNMGEIIKHISGVSNCFQDHFNGTQYNVFLDPRYDREWVKAEIEAQIKIQGNP